MMDWTDTHCRSFWRLLTIKARLYTEMVTTGALLHGDRSRFLRYSHEQHPLALQIGGSHPGDLAECAGIVEEAGFDEINLNVGCPSDRVQEGRIGACLMAEPDLVADCVDLMQNKVNIPVTVKHRIGIDDLDSYEHLHHFIDTVSQAGCQVFIIHARKAWLNGLSPKQNREVPPLNYEMVHRVKRDFPDKTIVINGGICSIEQCNSQLQELDGVMIGREAYNNPFFLASVDESIYHSRALELTRDHVLENFVEYCQSQIKAGVKLHQMTRHMLGLYHGQYGGKRFRRFISENAPLPDAQADLLRKARDYMNTAN